MKILMISDLHINNDSEEYKKIIFHRLDKMSEIICKEMMIGEKLIIVMCGDVVDSGKAEYYSTAKKVFDYMVDKTEGFNMEFVMVPGNHDLCDGKFCDFDAFATSYCPKQDEFEKNHCSSVAIDNLNFILANSTYHKDYSYGLVDEVEVEKNVNHLLDNILITHHSPISEDANDSAPIRHLPRLLDVVNRERIGLHLHGHTHGTYCTKIGNDCNSIGVGSLFLKAEEMGSQFNLITYNGQSIESICSYLYRIDFDKYVPCPVWERQEEKKGVPEVTEDAWECQVVEDYIPRLVGPYDVIQSGGISLYYHREQLKQLPEILLEKTRIVLLGEAGVGKTCELHNLEYSLKKSRQDFPIFISLDTYVDENIDELISATGNGDYKKNAVLIFDGYDEIEDRNLNTFAKRLNAYVKCNPQQKIIISTRNNFYKNALDETNQGTFSGFYECGLCPLQGEDILKYLKKKSIDTEAFMGQVREKKLSEQVKNPFFLIQIVDLYLVETELPLLNELMDKLVDKSFKKDVEKYVTTKDLQEQRNETIKAMQMVAFALQCMKKVSLDDAEYQELVDRVDRDNLRYCGIWEKTGEGKWKFEHNNFREYLVAQYLKKKSLDEIIELVTYPNDSKKIRNSWVNVLTFLVLIYEDENLVNWIIETSPSIAVKFEKTRLNESIRTKIFCAIMEEHKNANLWISRNQNDEEELARFGQTKDAIEYLVNEIEKPCHFWSLSNAICIIGKMRDFCGKREAVRNVLLKCCVDLNIRRYEVQSAILALANRELYDTEDIRILLERFGDDNDSNIRYAIYCYILEYQLQDSTIDYVLRGIEKAFVDYEFNVSERYRVSEILKGLESYESIHKVFAYIIEKKDCYEAISDFEDTFSTLCVKAEALYQKGKVEILDDIQILYMKAANSFENNSMKATITFLKNTNQVYSTYERILSLEKNNDIIFMLEPIMNEKCIDDFVRRYEKGTLLPQELFGQYIRRRRRESYRQRELVELLYQKEGVVIEEKEAIDYDTLRREGQQRYFDALFSKEKFQVLIQELANSCNGEKTTYEDLKHSSFKNKEDYYELEQLRWGIRKNNFKDRTIVNFMKYVYWQDFAISQIYKMLRDKRAVKVSKEQEDVVKEWCKNVIPQMDFEKEVVSRKDGTSTFSYRVIWCLYFTQRFSVEYDEKVLKSMLMIPGEFFLNEKKVDTAFSPYILERLDEATIRKQVCVNLKNKKIEGNLAETYIEYCKQNDIEEVFELAESILLDMEYYEWTRRVALRYVIYVKGGESVIEKYLEHADDVLLKLFVDELWETRSSKLSSRLIDENQKSKDGLSYIKTLIMMGCGYGLEKYYEIAKERDMIPDWTEDDNNVVPVTEAIAEVSEKENLEIIMNLAWLATKKGFKDREHFGLYNSVSQAVHNIGQNNPEYTLRYLREVKEQKDVSDKFVAFCNFNISLIEEQYDNQRDVAWNIDHVKMYLGTLKY